MSVSSFEELMLHIGHKIVVATYGTEEEVVNVAIECEDCNMVLLEFDKELNEWKSIYSRRYMQNNRSDKMSEEIKQVFQVTILGEDDLGEIFIQEAIEAYIKAENANKRDELRLHARVKDVRRVK